MKNNAAGGKDPWGDRAGGTGKREGVAGETGPKDPGGDEPRDKVRELLTLRSRCHADIRKVIADLNPVLKGWGQYFRTGNADTRFNQLDSYVWRRLLSLRLARKGRNVQPGEVARWSRESFENLGLCRLRGTVRYPASPFWESRNAAV